MAYSYEPHYFEDFEVGQTFGSVGWTVIESDFVIHSMFTGDWTELRTNGYFAEEEHFDGRVAHSPVTFSLATGFVCRCGIIDRTVYAFLGMNYMDIPDPFCIDDTITLDMEVVKKRKIPSKDDAGLVTIATTMTNQEDSIVFEGDVKFLIKRRE